jgi:hypothetical protein
MAPLRRQRGAMSDSSPLNVRDLDRINLRLSAETFAAIDSARAMRAGHVSRNTWLTEAVQEKLARETLSPSQPEERQHG